MKIIEEHLVLDIKTTIRLQKLHCKNFWLKNVCNERGNSCFDDKEQKARFMVVSRSDLHIDFDHPFFACPIRRANKDIQGLYLDLILVEYLVDNRPTAHTHSSLCDQTLHEHVISLHCRALVHCALSCITLFFLIFSYQCMKQTYCFSLG